MTRWEAFIEKDWENMGLAQVVMLRVREGVADYAVLLVDLFCLGVKEAFAETGMPEVVVREELLERLPEDFRDRLHPACARKLVEGAVAYAKSLGFAPHLDFRKARKVFSGVDVADCPQIFVYGRDGRPCYIRGPNDSDERADRVCTILEAGFGPEGFDYEEPNEESLDPEMVREELVAFFEAEPDGGPNFYHFSGAMTALLLAPEPVAPLKILDTLWAPEGRTWESTDDLSDFTALAMDYWNSLNEEIDAVLEDPVVGETFVDVWSTDFEESTAGAVDLLLAHQAWCGGFLRVIERWPDIWTGFRDRPELKAHWDMVVWWSTFEREESQRQIAEQAQAPVPRGLDTAVHALARAAGRPFPRA